MNKITISFYTGLDIFEVLPVLRVGFGRNGIYENQFFLQFSIFRFSFQVCYTK